MTDVPVHIEELFSRLVEKTQEIEHSNDESVLPMMHREFDAVATEVLEVIYRAKQENNLELLHLIRNDYLDVHILPEFKAVVMNLLKEEPLNNLGKDLISERPKEGKKILSYLAGCGIVCVFMILLTLLLTFLFYFLPAILVSL